MIGLHPCDVSEENYKHEIAHVEKELETGKYIAVGEIGLDLHWDKSTLEIQKKAFIHQVKLAKKYKLPLAIHVRESFAEAIELIEKLNDENLRGVFHCFTGTLEQAHRAIDLNFYLGIGGVVTFKKAGLDAVVKDIDLKHLVLETDSPYLAPSPNRGKRNESSYLIHIAQKVANLHQVPIERLAQITTDNSIKLFGC